MIRTDSEYRTSLARIEEQAQLIARQEKQLKEEGMKPDQVRRALEPLRAFAEQLRHEVETYERLSRHEFDEITNLQGLGQMLIGIRIAMGLTQRDLAERLNVHETQVSRDERNEYYGITVDRASRILDALQVEVKTIVKRLPPAARSA